MNKLFWNIIRIVFIPIGFILLIFKYLPGKYHIYSLGRYLICRGGKVNLPRKLFFEGDERKFIFESPGIISFRDEMGESYYTLGKSHIEGEKIWDIYQFYKVCHKAYVHFKGCDCKYKQWNDLAINIPMLGSLNLIIKKNEILITRSGKKINIKIPEFIFRDFEGGEYIITVRGIRIFISDYVFSKLGKPYYQEYRFSHKDKEILGGVYE